MQNQTDYILKQQTAEALKKIARRTDIKAYIEQDPVLYRLIQRAAKRYVAGEQRMDALKTAETLRAVGYAVSLEYIGENTATAEACEQAAAELSKLIADLGAAGGRTRVSFDLSHIGLLLDADLSLRYLLQLAEQAQPLGIELFISMEESAKTERILSVYEQAAAVYSNIGITLQAQLHRTIEDAAVRLPAGARVRIVKGAYQEPQDQSLSRSDRLNERYIELVRQMVTQKYQVSIATHDRFIIDQINKQPWSSPDVIEYEMLYGVCPDQSTDLKKQGYPVRIYLTYGQEWYLYLCHRIAEHPANLMRALVDIVNEEEIDLMNTYQG